MRIPALGVDLDHPDVEHDKFRAARSMLDYDIVVLDPVSIPDEYATSYPPTYRGLRRISADDSPRLVADVNRRRAEIVDMLDAGRMVVVFTPDETACYVDTGQRQYSGTGRSRTETVVVQTVEVRQVIPLKLAIKNAEGSAISGGAQGALAAFWKRVAANMVYRATIESSHGSPILSVSGTKRTVGLEALSQAGGRLYLLPSLAYPARASDKTVSSIDNEFVEALIELAQATSGVVSEFPAWTEEYTLPAERRQRVALQDIQGRVDALLRERDAGQAELAQAREPKRLFAGTGPAFEAGVRAAFEALGAEVSVPRPGRTDFVLATAEGPAVVEAKGVAKSAAEAHAAQLEKWVSEYIEQHEESPKGILVINTYRDIPPSERPEPFPAQMLPYSQRRGHCLMTGLQLLGAVVYAGDDAARQREIIQEIFRTEGVFGRFADWRETVEGPIEVTALPARRSRAAPRR